MPPSSRPWAAGTVGLGPCSRPFPGLVLGVLTDSRPSADRTIAAGHTIATSRIAAIEFQRCTAVDNLCEDDSSLNSYLLCS